MRVYMDGVFDLFHRGHLESINNCLKYGDYIIIGVVSDEDAKKYKRKPIINEIDRVKIVKNISKVNDVIFPCPLVITKKFILDNKIDIVVHGFFDEKDFEKQKEFFQIPIEMGIFKKVQYYKPISTTDIINKIKNEY